jgi:hypothetical protein
MKRKILTGTALAFLLCILACNNDHSDFNYNIPKGSYVLMLNKPQNINNDISININEIIDTRCPLDSICSTAGNVLLICDISHISNHYSDTLDFNQTRQNNTYAYDEFTIIIHNVTPYPDSKNQPIAPGDYRVILSAE